MVDIGIEECLWSKKFSCCVSSIKVLSSFRDYASTYIDDVLVHSADWEVHKKDLGRVLAALESAGITAQPGKC